MKNGHEFIYRAQSVENWDNFPERRVEASVFAGLHLPLPYPSALQVRHPLKVISSWASTGLFDGADFVSRVEKHTGPLGDVSGKIDFRKEGVDAYRDHIAGIARFWCRWNRYCEQYADVVWRVEDLPNQTLADFIGVSLSALQAVEFPDKRKGSRRQNTQNITAADIPDDVRPELEETAAHYGYDLTKGNQ